MLFDPEDIKLIKRILLGAALAVVFLVAWGTWAITRILSAC